jgi:hypothetical protein
MMAMQYLQQQQQQRRHTLLSAAAALHVVHGICDNSVVVMLMHLLLSQVK